MLAPFRGMSGSCLAYGNHQFIGGYVLKAAVSQQGDISLVVGPSHAPNLFICNQSSCRYDISGGRGIGWLNMYFGTFGAEFTFDEVDPQGTEDPMLRRTIFGCRITFPLQWSRHMSSYDLECSIYKCRSVVLSSSNFMTKKIYWSGNLPIQIVLTGYSTLNNFTPVPVNSALFCIFASDEAQSTWFEQENHVP